MSAFSPSPIAVSYLAFLCTGGVGETDLDVPGVGMSAKLELGESAMGSS